MSAGWQIALATYLLVTGIVGYAEHSLKDEDGMARFHGLLGGLGIAWLATTLDGIIK